MNTYQSFYINEIRALELTINDREGQPFCPSGATVTIKNESGSTVVSEQAAMVSTNRVRTIIGTTVTSTVGEYKVIWKIRYGSYSYYHVTILEVQDW